jgi:hypothetical protein
MTIYMFLAYNFIITHLYLNNVAIRGGGRGEGEEE